MNYYFVYLIIALNIVKISFSQDFNNYTPLTCSGPIPKDFTDRTSEKVAEEIARNTKSTDSYKARKDKNNYLLKSNYMLDELLMSGRVLFGDPVSIYVNKVADKLLEKEPKHRNKLRFYCLKSNVTNAFCTNQGMIFVTLGLIAQLENEAQLAQVLAHEITHYTKKHVINTFIESTKVSNTKGKYKYSNYDDNIIKLSNYSKSLEFEADSIGFFRLKKAGYSIQEALTVFDVLEFSYLPFNEQPFSYSAFENETVKIPETYKLDTLIPISFNDDYDDTKSSHPNIRKRREKIISLIKDEKGGEKFIQSKALFKQIRTTCRFENIRLNNKSANYVKAIYNAQILQNEYPNSEFLEWNILKAMYGISKYKLSSKYHRIADDFDEYEGEITAAYYFFESLSIKQTTSIALEMLNNYYLKYNANEYSKKLIQNLIVNLYDEYEDIDFSSYKKNENIDTVANNENVSNKYTESNSSSKYAKLRAIQKEQESSNESTAVKNNEKDFHLSYLYNAKNAQELQQWFNEAKVASEDKNKDPYEGMSYYKKKKAKKKQYKKASKNPYDNFKIESNKVVFVDPDYFVVDERKGQKLENAEEKKYAFYNQVEMVSKKAGIEYEILSPKVFNTNDAEKYNDLAKINDWVGERMMHEKLNTQFITSEFENVQYLSQKYKTKHFLYTGVLQFKEKKDRLGLILVSTIIYFPLLPYGIYYALTPKNNTFYYNLWYDINQNENSFESLIHLKTKANQANINSMMFDMLNQIKK